MFSTFCALYCRATTDLPRHRFGAIDAKIGKSKTFDNTFLCESSSYKLLAFNKLRIEFVLILFPARIGLSQFVENAEIFGLKLE